MGSYACDLFIRDGMVLDGLGGPPSRLDVAIGQGVLKLLTPGSADVAASDVIHAAGMFVAPGFIDIHGHSDFSSLISPEVSNRVAAGVTTECNGNCGYGAFPLAGEVLQRRQDEYAPQRLELNWHDVEQYFALADRIGCSINRVTLVGHGNVRGCVIGYGSRPASAEEVRQMAAIVDRCMAAGCAGLSSGLTYPPGAWADVAEMAELAGVAARHGGLYASHVRNEGERLLEAVAEFLEVLRRSGCRGQLSHVKTSEPANHHKLPALGQALRAARDEGLRFAADRYPYVASATDLGTFVLPRWAVAGTQEECQARLAHRPTREKIMAEVRAQKGAYLPAWFENVVVATVGAAELRGCVGKNLRELTEPMGLADPLEAAIKLVHDDNGATQAVHFSMSADNLREIYTWDFVAVGSDSSGRDYFGAEGPDRPHPRAYGTPAQFLDLTVRKWGILDWPRAVRRLTSLPAESLGLKDRGVLRDGAAADVVVFDPATVADRATYAVPCQAPAGIVATVVNGQVVWRNGAHTHRRPGKLLRPT